MLRRSTDRTLRRLEFYASFFRSIGTYCDRLGFRRYRRGILRHSLGYTERKNEMRRISLGKHMVKTKPKLIDRSEDLTGGAWRAKVSIRALGTGVARTLCIVGCA